jgi:hypothetical protein
LKGTDRELQFLGNLLWGFLRRRKDPNIITRPDKRISSELFNASSILGNVKVSDSNRKITKPKKKRREKATQPAIIAMICRNAPSHLVCNPVIFRKNKTVHVSKMTTTARVINNFANMPLALTILI